MNHHFHLFILFFFISIVFLLTVIPDVLSSPRGGWEGAALSWSLVSFSPPLGGESEGGYLKSITAFTHFTSS